jgi:hypothetical protein
MPQNAPKRRISTRVDYPGEDLVDLVEEGEGQLRKAEPGYLVVGEDNVVRFVPEFDRSKDAPTGA